MVIAFTSTARGECIAYSQDDGATWKEFEGNPVIKHSGRDPRLLWHRETKQWVMAVYSERPGAEAATPKRGIAFYTSADLKCWQERSWIGGYYECPDLFALPIDGDAKRMKWVLSCAPGYYSIGEFDGSRFIPESPRMPAPAGGVSNAQILVGFPLFYAAQTFSDHPEGHRVQLTPSALLADLKGEAWDIDVVIRVGTVSPVLMNLGADEYVYHPASQMLSGPKGAMAIPLAEGRLQLRVLVDRTTVEIFGDRGQAYGMFVRSHPGGNAPLELRTWELIADAVYVERLSAHSLRSAWKV